MMTSLRALLILFSAFESSSQVKAAQDESYSWPLYPKSVTDSRIYGYDSAKNKSIGSDPLPSSVLLKRKNGLMGMFVPNGETVILGNFVGDLAGDRNVCRSFTISFLVCIEASLAIDQFVHVLKTASKSKGFYYIGFTVTRNIARLEAEAYVVAGKSPNILKRTAAFPGTGKWVHVAMVYTAFPEALELYMNSQCTVDPVLSIPWNGKDQEVKIALGNTKTTNPFFISVLQILKGQRGEDEIQQLEIDSLFQAKNPLTSEVKLVQKNMLIVMEEQGSFNVEFQRSGNLSTLSLIRILTSGEAILGDDFIFAKLPSSREIQIRPGEAHGKFTVLINNDIHPEGNETMRITLAAEDEGTSIIGAEFVDVIIIDNDVDECFSNPCKNEAKCQDGNNSYSCICAAGYTGQNCETDVNDCTGNICKNNGTCIDKINDYNCTCSNGFTGKNCETDIDDCAVSPCKNHGTCQDGTNDFHCICSPGYTGKDCGIGSVDARRSSTGLAIGGGTVLAVFIVIVILVIRKWITQKISSINLHFRYTKYSIVPKSEFRVDVDRLASRLK